MNQPSRPASGRHRQQRSGPLGTTRSGRQGLFAALLSLPFVLSLSDHPRLPAPALPSSLAQCLMFAFLVTAPCLAWLYTWQAERASGEGQIWVRLGANRRKLLLSTLAQQAWTLLVVLYGLTIVCCLTYFDGWSLHVGKELTLLLPVAASWAVLLLLSLRAIARWTKKWGLWIAAVAFPFATIQAISYGWGVDAIEPTLRAPLHVLLSPFFHIAQLLGAFSGPHQVAGWVSFAVLHLYSALSLLLVLIRSPR